MVTNLYMKCEVCGSVINLKWQVGYIEQAPVSIVCPRCKTVLKFTLITDQENITLDMKTKNARQVDTQDYHYIAETSSELLTYKISTQSKIIPGLTPFIRMFQMLEDDYEEFSNNFLLGISANKNYLHIYHRVNDLYYNKNYEYLIEQLKEILEIEVEENFDEVKIIEYLYTFNINFYSMYFKKNTLECLNSKNLDLMNILRTDKRKIYDEFLIKYCTNDMLNQYDKRLYNSINTILNNYYLFLPSTILDYISNDKHDAILKEYTLTTTDFKDIKHIYLEIYENLLNVYDFIIMLNNIIERNSYNEFSKSVKINGKHINSIEQFTKLTKGYKLKFMELDESYNNLMPNFDRKIRNAIGHESWDYIPYEHKIEFKNDNSSDKEEMYLLEFVYSCWSLLDKTIIIYKVIQDIKRHRLMLLNEIV